MLRMAAIAGGAVLALLAGVARRVHAVMRAAILIAIVLVAIGADRIEPSTPWMFRAYLLLYAPAALGGVAMLLASPHATRCWQAALPTAALAACLAADLAGARRLTTRTTDEDEAAFAMRWRSTLPRGAVVHYLGSAGRRRVFLPLHEGSSQEVLPRQHAAEEPLRPLRGGDRPTFYYASSLCSTPEGRGYCAGVEGRFVLEEVAGAELTSQASLPGLDLDASPVRVVLYRCVGER
jgi:hypothetical protein